MEKILYKYSSRGHRIATFVLCLVGAVLALLAGDAMIFNLGSISSSLISYGALIVMYYLQVFAIVAFIAVGFLSYFLVKKSTRFTLAALIVTLIVYALFTLLLALNTVMTMQFVIIIRGFETGWLSIALYAGLLLLTVANVAAWIVFAIGHYKVHSGVRNKKLIGVGFWLLIGTVVALFVLQVVTNVINVINLDGYVSYSYDSVNLVLPVSLSFVAFVCGLAGVACVAVAYYLLSRSPLTEKVITVPVVTVGKKQTVTLDGSFKQNIALNIFLTIITAGIYGYVWFYNNAKRLRQLRGEDTTHCVDELLLSILGGPLYRAYWYYTRSKILNDTAKSLGYKDVFFPPQLYLVLAILTPPVFQLAFLTANYNKLFNIAAGFEPTDPEINREPLELRYSLLKVVVLSIVTFGIYYIITVVRLTNKTRALQGKAGVNNVQFACMLFVPLYWVYWLISRDEKFHEGSNEATLEAWMLLVVPMYSIYWLITRMAELKRSAEKIGVSIATESIWSFLFAILTPLVAYANMLSGFNKVSEAIIRAEVMQIRSTAVAGNLDEAFENDKESVSEDGNESVEED